MLFVTTIRGYRDAKHIGPLATQDMGSMIGTLFGVLTNGTISTIVQTNDKLATSWPNILPAVRPLFHALAKGPILPPSIKCYFVCLEAFPYLLCVPLMRNAMYDPGRLQRTAHSQLPFLGRSSAENRDTSGTVRMIPTEPATLWINSMAMVSLLMIWISG